MKPGLGKPRWNRLLGILLMAGLAAVFAAGCFFPRGGSDPGLRGGYNPPLAAGGLVITKGNDGVTEILSNEFTVPSVDFSKTGVVAGDVLVLLSGANRGQYTIQEITKSSLVVEGLGSQSREPGLAYEVRGSRIFFAGIDGYVYALGETVLSREAELVQRGGSATPGGAPVFGSAEADGFLYAVDPVTRIPKQGSKLGWRRPEGRDQLLVPLVAAPALERASNTLLVGSEDGNLYAYDAVTGEEKWRFATGGKIWSTPVVRDGVVYFGSHDRSIYAVFLDSGEQKWKADTGGVVAARPLLFRDQVIIGSFDQNLYSLDTQDGSERWKVKGTNWFWAGAVTDGSTIFAPSMDGNIYALDGSGRLLWGSEDGNLYAYDAVTGEEKWRFATGGKIWSTPVVRDGVVYFGSHDRSIYAVFLDSGEQKWKADTGGVVAARPLLFRDQVIIGSFDQNLYSLDTQDGSERWKVKGTNWFWAGAVTDGSTIFAPSMDGNIYALDGSGRLLWKHQVGSSIVSTPVILPQGLVVAGKDGTITVLDKTTQDIGLSRVLYSPSPRDAEITAPLFANGSSVFVGANDSTVTRVDVVSQKQIWCFHTKDSICN